MLVICRFRENSITGALGILKGKFYFGLAKLVLVGTDQEEKLGSGGQEKEDIDGA